MRAIILFWLLIASNLLLAQPSGNDVIHKLDRSTLKVKIDELTDSEIVYIDLSAPGTKKTLPRNQVWKIVFSDGSTEMITAKAGQSTESDQIVLVDQTVVEGKVVRRDAQKLYYTKPTDPTNSQFQFFLTRIDRIRYADGREEVLTKAPLPSTPKQELIPPVDVAPARMVNSRAFSRMQLTVGPEVAYYPTALNQNKVWLDDSTGFGMKQNIGGSLRFSYRFFRAAALSLTAGYYGWELVRKYTREGFIEYNETKKLTQIPVQLGIKLYPFRTIYLMPEVGSTFLFSNVKTSEMHPTPVSESAKSIPITYGGSLGYELQANSFILDLSLRYQLLNVKNLQFSTFNQTLNEQVGVASLRIGIGFSSPKK